MCAYTHPCAAFLVYHKVKRRRRRSARGGRIRQARTAARHSCHGHPVRGVCRLLLAGPADSPHRRCPDKRTTIRVNPSLSETPEPARRNSTARGPGIILDPGPGCPVHSVARLQGAGPLLAPPGPAIGHPRAETQGQASPPAICSPASPTDRSAALPVGSPRVRPPCPRARLQGAGPPPGPRPGPSAGQAAPHPAPRRVQEHK